jgi:hypothetical protein
MTENIMSLKKLLAEEIRQEIVKKVDIWKKIRYWALEADGRLGFSDRLSYAYTYGIWLIETSSHNYRAGVDLETGQLIYVANPNKTPLTDGDVIILLEYEIDADKILARLINMAKKPIYEGYDIKENNKWRQKTRKQLGLSKPIEDKDKGISITFYTKK